MTIDTRYITTNTLEPVFLDKNTGLPLANGTVEFWQDDNRVVPKNVFELTGAPPNYQFIEIMANPINLSSIGTLQDNAGNNVAIYYYPYDSMGNQQLYYVVVRDQFGNLNFTREAWPNTGIVGSGGSSTAISGTIENMISNPQFVDVNFGTPATLPRTLSINYTGAGMDIYQIAPDWEMQVTHSGAGTIILEQHPVAGTDLVQTNPPFTLAVTPGANITALLFRQKILNDPSIWASTPNSPAYLNVGALLSAGTFSMDYAPNSGVPSSTNIFLTNIAGPGLTYFNQTVLIPQSTNANDGNTGYVAIELSTPIAGAFSFSSVQAIGLNSDIPNVPFQQLTAARQVDHLFHYYQPFIDEKPIPSYLVGWDFPLNPAQFFGPNTLPFPTGNNSSNYYWDQLIIFQSANNGAITSRSPTGSNGLRVVANVATQFALIQYIPAPLANDLLQNYLSVNVAAITATPGGVVGTISLWYTAGALPSTVGASQSLVATLDANGKPATFNGAWTEIPRNGVNNGTNPTSILGNAAFTVTSNATANFNDYAFNGWGLQGGAGADTATFVAIVVGFATLPIGDAIDFSSISLIPGSIPTRPAPQKPDEVLRECQCYYEKSFNIAVAPADNLGYVGAAVAPQVGLASQTFGTVPFKVTKYSAAPVTTTYCPSAAASNQCFDVTTAAQCSATNSSASQTNIGITYTPAGGSANGNTIAVQWTADSRLGL